MAMLKGEKVLYLVIGSKAFCVAGLVDFEFSTQCSGLGTPPNITNEDLTRKQPRRWMYILRMAALRGRSLFHVTEESL